MYEDEKEKHQDSRSQSHREDTKGKLELTQASFGNNILKKVDMNKDLLTLKSMKTMNSEPLKSELKLPKKKRSSFDPNSRQKFNLVKPGKLSAPDLRKKKKSTSFKGKENIAQQYSNKPKHNFNQPNIEVRFMET